MGDEDDDDNHKQARVDPQPEVPDRSNAEAGQAALHQRADAGSDRGRSSLPRRWWRGHPRGRTGGRQDPGVQVPAVQRRDRDEFLADDR